MGKTESQRRSGTQAHRRAVQEFGLVTGLGGRYPPGPAFGYPRVLAKSLPVIFPISCMDLNVDLYAKGDADDVNHKVI